MTRKLITFAALLFAAALGVGVSQVMRAAPFVPMPVAPSVPVVIPQILSVIPHDTSAFTQGLFIADTFMYESTGLVGRSSLRRVNAATGEVLHRVPVPGVFAEGIAALGGELVQLTWTEGIALRYDFPSLRPRGSMFRYDGEGWGLTTDGTHYIMSNGTDTLYWRDAVTFEVTRKVAVTHGGRPLARLNELEYVRGHVYANVWYENFIAQIDVANGNVVRVIDCSELVRRENNPRRHDAVLNGIAYCERSGNWYVTGKNWSKMFIVRF